MSKKSVFLLSIILVLGFNINGSNHVMAGKISEMVSLNEELEGQHHVQRHKNTLVNKANQNDYVPYSYNGIQVFPQQNCDECVMHKALKTNLDKLFNIVGNK